MSTDEYLQEMTLLLAAKAKSEYETAKAKNKIKLLKIRAKLESIAPEQSAVAKRSPKKPSTAIEKFIERYQGILNHDDLTLLRAEEHSPQRIAQWLAMIERFEGITADTVCRQLKAGVFRPGVSNNPQPRGKRTIDSISVIEMVHHLHGKTKKD